VPSLFRRKSADLVDDVAEEPIAPEETESSRPKAYTPSKKELGLATPKRGSATRRQAAGPPPANRREAFKRSRERQRNERAENMEGMRRGDEKYLLPRDRGPERALVRDIVDSRRTIGTFFMGGALIVLVGSFTTAPAIVQFVYLLWVAMLLALVVDSILICRKIKKLVYERYPKTEVRPRGLYWYAVTRSISFRRMRVPKPRVKIGEAI
jgi:hypothetical protein